MLAGAARGETGSTGGGGPVKLSDVYTWELVGHLSAPAMSTDNSQVGVAICPPF